jgi:peptide/nickel transport system permease protein
MRNWTRALKRDRRALVGVAMLLGFAAVSLLGPLFIADASAIVDVPLSPPSWSHWFGTTGQGQDVLAQTIVGARMTLGIGLLVGVLVTMIGALIGVSAGYFGGPVDDLASVGTNVFLVIPGLPLALVLAAYLPPGPVSLTVVLVAAGWAWGARVFRAEALSLRKKDFIAASQMAGEGHLRIIVFELLPNMASLVASSFIGTTLYAIGAQVGLEFLGLGDLGAVTWGTNLYWASNDSALLTGAWWTFVPTGACVALVGFALALVNFALDEVTNPRLRVPRRARRLPEQLPPARTPGPAADPNGPLVVVRDLEVRYTNDGGRPPTVDRVSFEIAAGEIFGLAGESGSGKSTIGHALLRLLPPSAEVNGEIRFAGIDVAALDANALRAYRWQDVAMVFQSAMSALNPVITIGDQFVDTFKAHGNWTRKKARARAAELLEMVGLDRRALDSYPHVLSGGQRQRVGVALALALQPRLLIMDEPTTALDVVVQHQILERIIGLQRELGFAILFITHDLPLLLGLANRIGILRDGKLVEVAATEKLRAAPAHPYTQVLLSSFPALPIEQPPAVWP